ncbi:hypothetical protein OPT61_g1306 [Boeremia exigua]|uniref:Uncharacterized protein n=1 Tax=Boeremia exigua TaxID=749465 RepID=A0ACC2IQT0_9PLEO|nr:hypothetical protein OPT61_g1306 [Boeremia exigua]
MLLSRSALPVLTDAVVRSLQYTYGDTAAYDTTPVAPSVFPSQVFQFLSPKAASGRRAVSRCRREDSLPPPARYVPSTWFSSSANGVTQPHLMKRLWRLAVAPRIYLGPFSRSICSLSVLLRNAHGYQRGKPFLLVDPEAEERFTVCSFGAFFSGALPSPMRSLVPMSGQVKRVASYRIRAILSRTCIPDGLLKISRGKFQEMLGLYP